MQEFGGAVNNPGFRAGLPVMAAALYVFCTATTPAWSASDDAERCINWGAAPGTQAFYNCLSALEAERGGGPGMQGHHGQGGGPYAPSPSKPANIADGLALSTCEAHARRAAPYPIERLATKTVSGRDPKTASLSFKISKPGASSAFWYATCKFSGGRMVDFQTR